MIGLKIEFRMKIGFFETKIYDLLILKGELILASKESDKLMITIPDKSIINITLKKSPKSFEMEIQTDEEIYQGLLDNEMDYERFISQMKLNINKKILCEYEGGD